MQLRLARRCLRQPQRAVLLRAAILADWVNCAPRFHAIEFRELGADPRGASGAQSVLRRTG